MKTIKTILILILTLTVLNCASSKKMNNKLPLEIGAVYFQISVEESKGNSIITVFIPVISNVNHLKLDSIYFRGQQTPLKLDRHIFVGQFKPLDRQTQDIIMSNAPYAEYGNKAPKITSKSHLELAKDEALISYNVGNKTNYFKIYNITQKDL